MSDSQSTASSDVPAGQSGQTNQTVADKATVETVVNAVANQAAGDKAEAQPKQDERVSARFAALTRKEKRALEKANHAKQLEQAVQAREQELSQREAKLREIEHLVESNPYEFLKSRGVSYSDITGMELNDHKITPEYQIEQLRKQIEADKQAQSEAQAKAQQEAEALEKARAEQAASEFQTEIKDFIESNSQKYELTKLYDQSNLVYQTIDEHYNQTGKIMSIAEATQLVEAYLERELDKVLQTNKFKAKVPQAQPQPKPDYKQYTGQSKTLTNSVSSTTSSKRNLSDEERVKRAIAIARGELQN